MLVSFHCNAGENHNINISNKSFQNVKILKYLGKTVTNQIYIYGEVKSRLN
jgi:hypothetical protein